MNHHFDPTYEMGLQDFFTWRSQTAATATPVDADEELPADVDEPPDHRLPREQLHPDFHKSLVRPQSERKESLLTKAFQKGPEPDTPKSDIRVTTDLTRRRSMMSNASLASTAELTSDGGLTSPARTNTPSPPIPRSTYTSFAPYSFTSKPVLPPTTLVAKADSVESVRPEVISVSPKTQPPVEPVVKKRCITFMCDGKKGMDSKPKPVVPAVSQPAPVSEKVPTEAPQPRKCTIKFACTGPKPSEKACTATATDIPQAQKSTETQKRVTSRSPSVPRKSTKPALSSSKSNTSTTRRSSHSPVAVRAKPKYIIADEKTLQLSEATRFHEFCSEELQDDDWIRKDADIPRDRKLTINDTLKMENAIRALGNEAEEEALEDEEDDDEEDQDDNDSDVIDSDDEDVEEYEDEDDDVEVEAAIDSSDEGSDGNETDNEAGFAESDDESDGEGEFSFWTPGRKFHHHGHASIYRPSAQRTASISSIDSLNHMELAAKKRRSRAVPMTLRPGTPELPDSTDFVCGTLDEDRPLEDAYVSCIAAKNAAKHKRTPQDIDPSFPTSDIEDEEDENDDIEAANDSDEQVWLHGQFEESDNERYGRRRSTTAHRKSPDRSPRRLHSPPPPKQTRYRSPPPRKLFGHSPRRLRSPPPRHIRSPQASPSSNRAIPFAVLASRPGLTHTKSLPRTPNAFCRQYNASRLAAANGLDAGDNDGFQRGAIDIVKGLEQKRQRRKEKLYQKECNRKKKGHGERRPQPGKGAERMRELGLLMAGKTGPRDDPYMLSA